MYYTTEELIEQGIIANVQELAQLELVALDGGRDALPEDKSQWDVLYPNHLEGRYNTLWFPTKQDKRDFMGVEDV